MSVAVSAAPQPDVMQQWDALVHRTPGTDVTQLSAWARVRSTVGYSPLYVFARSRGVLAGGAQLLCRRLPVLGRVGYLPYGPLVDRRSATGKQCVNKSSRCSVAWGTVICVCCSSNPRKVPTTSVVPCLRAASVRPQRLLLRLAPSALISAMISLRFGLDSDAGCGPGRIAGRPGGLRCLSATSRICHYSSQLMAHSAQRQGFAGVHPADRRLCRDAVSRTRRYRKCGADDDQVIPQGL